MAKVKVCVSTRRIALVDNFPSGAVHPFNVSVLDVRFHDEDDECYARSESLGHFFVDGSDQLISLLKCFGLEWRDTLGFDDALEVLSSDYESRKRALDGLSELALEV